MRKWFIVLCVPMIILSGGCQLRDTEGLPFFKEFPFSEAVVREESLPCYTSYEVPVTFEYTEQMLYEMNEENEDGESFEIFHDNECQTRIEGHISRSPVSSEQGVIEQLMMIRSVLGLVNPKQQLFVDADRSSSEHYYYHQYYNGMRLFGSGVTVWVDVDTSMIREVKADIIQMDTLKAIRMDGLLDTKEIQKRDPSIRTIETVIWDVEYKEAPVVAYLVHNDNDMVFVYSAVDGSILDEWSTILT